MKIYCTKYNDNIKLDSIVEFTQDASGFKAGTQGKVTDVSGKWAWVWQPPVNGYGGKSVPVERSKLKFISQPVIDPLSFFDNLSGNFIDIQKEVISKYHINIDPYSHCWHRIHAHIKDRKVCKWTPRNSAQSTFDLFHEIGHIETTKSGMRRCEEEYYATVWAIERFNEYGIPVPMKTIKEYQEYIDDELARGQRRSGSNYNVDMDLYEHIK